MCGSTALSVTGRVGSVTTSAVKSLDASAKSLDSSTKYFGRVGEIFWTRICDPPRQNETLFDGAYNDIPAKPL